MIQETTIQTRNGTLVIRRATPKHVHALAAIGASTSAWLESLGIDPGRPPKPLREIAADRVREGSIYLASLDDAPAGMVTLLSAPEELWSDRPGDACYVHGLMVHRDFAGRQVGLELLYWAERETAERGKPLVRLDCMMENQALRRYYELAGYTHCGDVHLAHRNAARYEKQVG
jgi:ribosomal protein S18 acetylase RimI-like enzyme